MDYENQDLEIKKSSYVKIIFKDKKEILTDVNIEIIDNNLVSIGFIKVEDIENNINYIITKDSIYLIYEI